MTVLEKSALEASPLADLHAIASEISLDGYRRLRKADLIDAIIARQSGKQPDTEAEADVDAGGGASEAGDGDRRGGRTEAAGGEGTAVRRRRNRRGGRGRGPREGAAESETEAQDDGARSSAAPEAAEEPEIVEGVVELLANGSGFVRVSPPDPSDSDVYISAAQVKRCELVAGDRVSGPRRPPQRSERFASLVRIDTINGQPATQVADKTRFEDLPAEFPSERFKLGSEDPTLKAIEWLTPFGRGSRVAIVGGRWAGKSHALRMLASQLAADEALSVFVALAGVRPEEVSEWQAQPKLNPAASVTLSGSPDAQDHAVELVIDQARRIAARGAHAVVVIDSLDLVHPPAARKALAAARKIKGGGSLTVIATATRPFGGETTVITLDPALAVTGRFPSLDLAQSGTLRPELLVGEAGAKAIAEARLEALGG